MSEFPGWYDEERSRAEWDELCLPEAGRDFLPKIGAYDDSERDPEARRRAPDYTSHGWHSCLCVDLAIEAFINGVSYLELTRAARYVPSLEGLMRKLWNARQALGAHDSPLPPGDAP